MIFNNILLSVASARVNLCSCDLFVNFLHHVAVQLLCLYVSWNASFCFMLLESTHKLIILKVWNWHINLYVCFVQLKILWKIRISFFFTINVRMLQLMKGTRWLVLYLAIKLKILLCASFFFRCKFKLASIFIPCLLLCK